MSTGDVTQVLGALETVEDSEWAHVDGFEGPTPCSTRKKLNKAGQKAQDDKHIGNDVYWI